MCYDTDSVIYLHKEGLYRVPCRDYLENMMDELADFGPGSNILEFVSGDPKTYAYQVFSINKNSIVVVGNV